MASAAIAVEWTAAPAAITLPSSTPEQQMGNGRKHDLYLLPDAHSLHN